MSNKEWQGLCAAFDKPEWSEDPRFKTPSQRDKHVDERVAMTQEVLRARTTVQWLELLEAHDVPCAPALTRNELLRHPQVIAAGTVVETEHDAAGPLRQVRHAAQSRPLPPRFGAARHAWASTLMKCSPNWA